MVGLNIEYAQFWILGERVDPSAGYFGWLGVFRSPKHRGIIGPLQYLAMACPSPPSISLDKGVADTLLAFEAH
ncbi:hypothetical protein LJR098_000844 [Rhizobium sp. LjRoot98]|uniref:hypothetical protein n=1 Tax=Rhizobium sp. LjRoot98 TaxID=3342345 RepID=UPI003ECC9072